MIPFLDTSRDYQQNRLHYTKLADSIYSSGQTVAGKYTKKLEQELCKRTNRKHAVVVGSCTDALAFVAAAMDTKFLPTVYFSGISFPATNAGFLRGIQAGEVKYIDVDRNGNLDLDILEFELEHSHSSVNILVWVNLYGNMVDIDRLEAIIKKYNIIAVEDAAQSFGAVDHTSKNSGAFGIASCVSFDPTKNFGAFGLGGAVLTDNDDIAAAVRRQHRPWTADGINQGYNSQMNEVNAAVVWWKLKHLFEYIQTKRTSVSDYYDAQLKDTVDITQQPQGFKSCHKYVIFHPKRDELKQRLFQEGVETKIHYAKPLGENLPMANKICSQCLSLPIFPELEEKEAEKVTEKVIKIVNEIGVSTSRPVM